MQLRSSTKVQDSLIGYFDQNIGKGHFLPPLTFLLAKQATFYSPPKGASSCKKKYSPNDKQQEPIIMMHGNRKKSPHKFGEANLDI